MVRLRCLVLVFMLLAGVAPASAQGVITLAADEWCPYNCASDSAAPGYMVELARKAFEPLGIEVRYEVLNWARAVSDARSGAFTGVIGAIEADAEGFVFPRVAQGMDDSHFFIRKGYAWTFDGLDSLRTQRVGIIRDYSYGEALDAYFQEVGEGDHLQFASGDNGAETNLKKLVAERIDVVIANPYVFEYLIKELGVQEQVESAGPQGDPASLYIAFSPAEPRAAEFAERLSVATQSMRASGELAALLAKYGLHDWE